MLSCIILTVCSVVLNITLEECECICIVARTNYALIIANSRNAIVTGSTFKNTVHCGIGATLLVGRCDNKILEVAHWKFPQCIVNVSVLAVTIRFRESPI